MLCFRLFVLLPSCVGKPEARKNCVGGWEGFGAKLTENLPAAIPL